jgi:hypothetical protein
MLANPNETQLDPRTLRKLIAGHVIKNSCADVNKLSAAPVDTCYAPFIQRISIHFLRFRKHVGFVSFWIWNGWKSRTDKWKGAHRLSNPPFIHQENVSIKGILASGTRKWKVRCESFTPNNRFLEPLWWIFDYANEAHHIISLFTFYKN